MISYPEYIVSAEWYNRCRRFFGDAPQCSVRACRKRFREGRVQIHHRTYARLGRELSTDVLPLCDKCHAEAHKWSEWYREEDRLTKDAALRRGTFMVLLAGGSRDLLDILEAADNAERRIAS